MADEMEMLVFELDSERYALPLPDVREVVRAVAVTRLPHAPAVVEGMINVRGSVVPVMDVRLRFGLSARPLTPADRFILADTGERTVALRVDRVAWLVSVAPEDVADTRAVAADTRHFAGVVKLADGLVLIHDLRKFLSEAEAATLDRALEAARPEVEW